MSKSTISTMREDLLVLDICIDMLREPNSSSELVLETMCASLLIVKERIKALDSPILAMDITEEEYNQHFKELFIEHDVTHYKDFIFPDL